MIFGCASYLYGWHKHILAHLWLCHRQGKQIITFMSLTKETKAVF